MTAIRTTIAGIAIPDSAVAHEATEFVEGHRSAHKRFEIGAMIRNSRFAT